METPETAPPPPQEMRVVPFPTVLHHVLPNGLTVEVVPMHSLPILTLQLVIGVGAGYGPAGLASLTADLLQEGGTQTMSGSALAERVEIMGSQLSMSTGQDSTTLEISITRDQLEEALDILREVVSSPRFEEQAFEKCKARALDAAKERSRSDSTWMAWRLLAQTMFKQDSLYRHAYSATPQEITALGRLAIQQFYKQFYVPQETTLIVVGDTTPEEVIALANKHIGSWKGVAPPKRTMQIGQDPPSSFKILLAHRPQSVQSHISIAAFAPNRRQDTRPAVNVAVGVLGGNPASRLFLDVREKRSLAYHAGASMIDLAYSSSVLMIQVGTQTDKTATALEAVLENLVLLSTQSIRDQELEGAKRYLYGTLSIGLETVEAIASMVSKIRVLQLPDGYWDLYRNELLRVDLPKASEQAAALLNPSNCWIAIAGDADAMAESLTRFGEVTVFDPESEFKPLRVLAHKPTQGSTSAKQDVR